MLSELLQKLELERNYLTKEQLIEVLQEVSKEAFVQGVSYVESMRSSPFGYTWIDARTAAEKHSMKVIENACVNSTLTEAYPSRA